MAVAFVLVAAACQEVGHVRGNAGLTGVFAKETTISTANVSFLAPLWRSSTAVGHPDDGVSVLGNQIFTPTAVFSMNPFGCSGEPLACPPQFGHTGSTAAGPGGSSPTEVGTRTYVLPAASTSAASPTFAAFANAVSGLCSGSPLSCPAVWQADISAYDPTGTANVGGRGGATVVGDVVYVTSEATGHLFAFSTSTNACTGSAPASCQPLWAVEGLAATAPPAVVGDTVYVASAATATRPAGLYAIPTDASTCTGTPLLCEPEWSGTVTESTLTDPAQVTPPIVTATTAYVGFGPTMYAFATNQSNCAGSPATCSPRWTANLGPMATTRRAAPGLDGTKLYVLTDGAIRILDAYLGGQTATLSMPTGVTFDATGVALANGAAFVGSSDGLLAFDATCTATCYPILQTLRGAKISSPIVAQGRVYTLANGTLAVLAPTTPSDPDPTSLLSIGNTRNYLGTGSLLTGAAGTVTGREGMWLGISGYCTERHQGDRIASRYANGSSTNNTCAGTTNTDYVDTNYRYVVTVPSGRTSPIDVVIYDGNFLDGNAVTGEFSPGASQSIPSMSTAFALYAPDDTPDDDTDNETMASVGGCASAASGTNGSKTFSSGVTDDNYSVAIPGVTNATGMWLLCTIPPDAPAGQYLLKVRNQSSVTGAAAMTEGSNDFSIFALPTAPQQYLCDSLTDSLCPSVTTKDHLGVHVATAGVSGSADFRFLVIGPELRGRTIAIDLWDPAEGATSVEILKPIDPTTSGAATFDYVVSDGSSGSGVTRIYNGGSSLPYNNRLVTITFTVPADYAPPPTNPYWKVRYGFAGLSATDRTTWSARVVA